MGILLGILSLGFLILIHELGHLLVAKWSGIKVYEFAVGMGPKIVGKKINDTIYNLRLLPVGGYVKLAGLDPDEEGVLEEDKFPNKPWISRFLTLAAGSSMNILFGFILFYIIFFFVGIVSFNNKIETVVEDSPAYNAGLLKGDELTEINGKQIEDTYKDVISYIHNYDAAEPIIFTVMRRSTLDNSPSKLSFKIMPQYNKEFKVNVIGIEIGNSFKKFSIIQSFFASSKETAFAFDMMIKSLGMLLSGDVSMNEMSGPIGMIQISSHQAEQSFALFLRFVAIISIALGFMNLLPVPVLDGGHILFLIIELIIRRPVSQKTQLIINNAFAICLITFMIFIIFNDIRFWSDRTDLLNELK